MIDHISIQVRDLSASRTYYMSVLKPLGFDILADRPATVGFGKRYPEFWLNARPDAAPLPPEIGSHVCLRAGSRDVVEAFHRIALANGAKDDGAPGTRQGQMTEYFGAFIRDPDGNRIEVVTFPQT